LGAVVPHRPVVSPDAGPVAGSLGSNFKDIHYVLQGSSWGWGSGIGGDRRCDGLAGVAWGKATANRVL
jgi:hypothetical protein